MARAKASADGMAATAASSGAAAAAGAHEGGRFLDLPVLDFGPYLEATDEEERVVLLEGLARRLRSASQEIGFYFITGVESLVPEALVRETFEIARRFHDLDTTQKMAMKLNRQMTMGYVAYLGPSEAPSFMTESFNEAVFFSNGHGNELQKNPFPDEGLPELRAVLGRYDLAMHELTERIMLPVLARSLNLPLPELRGKFLDPLYNYRLTHYPVTPPRSRSGGELFGIPAHADGDFFTILAQNEKPGLSLQLPNGEWMPVPALPRTFLVNTGEMLHRMTNGRYRNTMHRVLCDQERHAVVCFVTEDRLVQLDPIVEPGQVAKWPSFTAVDVFRERAGLPPKPPYSDALRLLRGSSTARL